MAENKLCDTAGMEVVKANTMRWADVDAEDDLDSPLFDEKNDSAHVANSRVNSRNVNTTNSTKTGNSHNKFHVSHANLSREPPFIVYVYNLDPWITAPGVKELFRLNKMAVNTVRFLRESEQGDNAVVVEFPNFHVYSKFVAEHESISSGPRKVRISLTGPEYDKAKVEKPGNRYSKMFSSDEKKINKEEKLGNGVNDNNNRDDSPDFGAVRRGFRNAKIEDGENKPKDIKNNNFETRPKLNLKPRSKPVEKLVSEDKTPKGDEVVYSAITRPNQKGQDLELDKTSNHKTAISNEDKSIGGGLVTDTKSGSNNSRRGDNRKNNFNARVKDNKNLERKIQNDSRDFCDTEALDEQNSNSGKRYYRSRRGRFRGEKNKISSNNEVHTESSQAASYSTLNSKSEKGRTWNDAGSSRRSGHGFRSSRGSNVGKDCKREISSSSMEPRRIETKNRFAVLDNC